MTKKTSANAHDAVDFHDHIVKSRKLCMDLQHHLREAGLVFQSSFFFRYVFVGGVSYLITDLLDAFLRLRLYGRVDIAAHVVALTAPSRPYILYNFDSRWLAGHGFSQDPDSPAEGECDLSLLAAFLIKFNELFPEAYFCKASPGLLKFHEWDDAPFMHSNNGVATFELLTESGAHFFSNFKVK